MPLRKYVVSQDKKSKLWYCHKEGYSYLPCFGSFCEKKSEAKEYAKMYNGLENNVRKIENKRLKEKD